MQSSGVQLTAISPMVLPPFYFFSFYWSAGIFTEMNNIRVYLLLLETYNWHFLSLKCLQRLTK